MFDRTPPIPTAPVDYRPALNQPPVPGVGKTGFYYTLGRTCYRAPEAANIGGEVVHGHRLPYKVLPKILRAFRSKYAPHIGRKQMAKTRNI